MKFSYFLSLVIFLVASALGPWSCDPRILSNPGPGPQPTPEPAINITKAEYETAFVKWQSAAIEEYEMVVRYSHIYSGLSGTWTLRVRGQDVTLVNQLREGVPVTPTTRVSSENLKFLTVEEMFARIKKVADDPSQAYITIGGERHEVRYRIVFDDNLGYPTSFIVNPTGITDNDSMIGVDSLKVLKKRGS